MKKNSLFQYLLFIIFLLLTNCNEKSDSALNNNECVDIVCDQNLNEFLLKISVSMTPYDIDALDLIGDYENYLGVMADATNGYDLEYDILESPNGPGNWISLYFPHPEWEHDLGENFTQDVTGDSVLDLDEKSLEWIFNIESNVEGTINLNFETISDYCYDCIESIQLSIDEDVYIANNMSFSNINISRFLQQNQILSFNLQIHFK